MSCYTRHLEEQMPDGPRPQARRQLDAAVRSLLGMPDADCPEVWEAVKARRSEVEAALVAARRGEVR